MIRTIREGDRWKLQTAGLHLRHPGTGRRIILLSMIHIGLPSYYTRLSEMVQTHKGTVLYEGVGLLGPEEVAELTPDEAKVYASLSQLHEAYRKIAGAVNLVAQPDAMPKPEPDWVRADLPVRELLRRWAAGRLPLIPLMEGAGDAFSTPFARGVIRMVLLGEPLVLATLKTVKGVVPGIGRTAALLIDERNEAALAAFDGLETTDDVIMTYGAAHISGLLAGFRARGYRLRARDWFTAHEERLPYTDMFDRWAGSVRSAFGRSPGPAAR